ncbi:MAG: glycine cleavage T C-terminal barrel domain-containing protein, partial [Pseudomonadota bacterium]
KLLELVYTNDWANLKPQRGRYGLMLTDDGLILDDGVTFKLGDDHYLMTTSTGHADSVYRHLEEILQVERPDWRVWVTPVTEQWANATVCGPLARDFMAVLGTDIDLAREAFPFMAMREGQVAGLPARVFRVSFTGELSYEINVPARQGAALWEKVMAAGSPFGITPVGSETSHLLRVEKGFLSLGHEVDGTADPYDLGLGWMISKKKPDFLGKRALEIRRAGGGARRELVGLLIDDPNDFVPEGSPITPGGRKERTEGFVSACTWSAASVRVVALGMLSNGGARHGERVFIRLKEQVIGATVTDPIFHDPAGERLRS